MTREKVMREIEETVRYASDWLEGHTELKFLYRHDASITDPEDQLVKNLLEASHQSGLKPNVVALPASSDAFFYNVLLGIPTVMFGPGDGRKYSHTDYEQIQIDDVLKASEVYVQCVLSYGNVDMDRKEG